MFYSLTSPSPNFPGIRPKFSRKFWNDFVSLSRVKFLGNLVHTKIAEKFGTGALDVKFLGKKSFTRNFPTNLEQELWGCPVKFPEKFRVQNFLEIWASNFQEISFPRNFRNNFQRSSGAVFQEISGSKISWKFWELFGNCWLYFLFQNSPGIWDEKRFFARLHETSNF